MFLSTISWKSTCHCFHYSQCSQTTCLLCVLFSSIRSIHHEKGATPIPVERGVHGRTIPVERPGRGGRDVAWSPKPLLLSSPGRCGRRQPERPPSLFRLRCRIGFNCGSRRPRLLRSSPQRPASSSHLAVWRATGSPCGDQVGKEEEYCFSGWEANGDAVVVQS